jgi:hypothetical protein
LPASSCQARKKSDPQPDRNQIIRKAREAIGLAGFFVVRILPGIRLFPEQIHILDVIIMCVQKHDNPTCISNHERQKIEKKKGGVFS